MKKINIREALLKLDKDSCCRYDLTTLYESCKLDDEDKVKLVQYIDAYEHPSIIGGFLESKCDCINESYDDDDVSDIAGAEKVVKEINENEVPLIFSDDIDDEEEVKTIPLTEEVVKSDAKEVRKYVWDKILPFDNLTDDDSYYWEFDQDIRDGFAARLVSDEIDIPDNATYKFSLPEVGLNFFLQDNPEYCYYVIDKDAVEPFSKVDEAVDIGECPICNRKFAEGELNSDGACPKCGEHLHKTDSGAYEKTDDDLDESVDVESIVGWLAEHDQAYDDALAHFKTDDLNSVSESDLIDWIGEHDQLYQDYLNFFKLEEGLWDDIKSVGKTVGKVAKKAWDNSYTKAIGTGLKKNFEKSNLGKATKEIGDSIKATDTYKKVAGKVNDAKDFVKNNVGSRQRDPQKLSIEHRGKNYRMSDLKYKLNGKEISPEEYASLGMLKRNKARIIVPRGAKPIQKESLNLYEAFNLCEDVDTAKLSDSIKTEVSTFMRQQGFDASDVDGYTAVEIKDTEDNMIQVEVRAELSYDDLMELSNELDPMVQALDRNAYFEPVTSGIMRAYIRKDQSDDIADEEAVAQWTDKINACKSIDDLREVYLIFNDQCDNNQYSGGTIDAVLEVVHSKLDTLDESLNENIGVGSLVTHIDDASGTRGTVVEVKGNTAKICVGDPANKDYVEVPLDKLQLDESINEAKAINEDFNNSVVLESELFYDNVDNCTPEELATFKKLGWIAGRAVVIPEGTKLTYHSSSNSSGAGYNYYCINSTEDLIGFSNQDPQLDDVFGEVGKEIVEESKSIKEGVDDPDEVLNFKRDVESATDLVDIQNLIWSLSDGVAEESIQQAFDENETEDLQVVKDAVIRELDIYLEDNEWLGESKSINESAGLMIYLFPELTDEDLEAAKGYGLTFLGKNHGADGSEDNWVLRGAESSLRMFADKYLGYELHPNYLYDEDEFAGDIINEGFQDELGEARIAEEAPTEDSELDTREQIGRRVSVDGEVGTVIDTDETLDGSLRLKVKVGTEDDEWVDEDEVKDVQTETFDDDFSDEELASILGGDTKYDVPDGIETPEETEARLAEDSSDRVITKQEILNRICELEDFKIDTGIRGSWVSAESQKPDWNNSAGLVSVECWNDNEVTVYSFAEGARKEIYKTTVHSEEELEALVAKVAEIQQEQLEVYKANPQEHYENSYRYKERAALQALDSRVDEIAVIVAKYPKAKFNPLNKTVLCASESDANDICNEIDFAKCQISKVRNSRTPYEVNIQPVIE